MNKLIVLCAVVLASSSLPAQTYKWVDERGVTNYGEKPPADRPAKAVDTHPGTIESSGIPQKKFEADSRQTQDTSPVPPQARVAQAAGPRGMSFDIFVRLQNGMSEGELVLRAGRPDAVGRGELSIIYYYLPTAADPFITTVTVWQGRIVNIEREKKTF